MSRPHRQVIKSCSKIDQSSFLHVKQRLDSYYLPSNFPIQMTELLCKLLQKLDMQSETKIHEKQNYKYQTYKAGKNNERQNIVDMALRHQMSHVIKENNQLHMNIITLKEQLQTTNHKITKIQINKHNNKSQLKILTNINNQRQRNLQDQLDQIKYKYNQLMDLVHNDQPKQQKQYIKRLLKHKNYSYETNNLQSRKRGITADETSKINKRSVQKSSITNQIMFLKQKVENRQKQILRLQSKLQFDGLNMNKILKDFNQHKQKQAHSKINQRVNFLEHQNKKIKDQNEKMKKEGGDKQALREHIQKLKQQIQQFKQSNQTLKRKNRQVTFDGTKDKNINKRKLNQTTKHMQSVVKQKITQQTKVIQLSKKLQTLQNSSNRLQKQLLTCEQSNSSLNQQILSLQKQIQNQRLMKQYQIQRLAQRQHDLLTKLSTKQLQRNQQKQLGLRLIQQNKLLNQSVINLQKIQQQLMRKTNSQVESTNYIDRTTNQQPNSLYRQELNQFKNKFYHLQADAIKNQRQLQNATIAYQKYRKQCQLLKQQNKLLNKLSIQSNLSKDHLLELRNVNISLKQSLEIERQKSLKLQAQLQNLQSTLQRQKINHHQIQQQYHHLKISQKQHSRNMQLSICELQQQLSIKHHKIQQRQIRIKNLQTQLMESTQKQRQSSKQLCKIDEQLHLLRMDKNRLERKYTQLLIQYQTNKQHQNKANNIKEIQLRNQIEKLHRDSNHNKLMTNQFTSQLDQLINIKANLQKQIHQLYDQREKQRLELQNYKQREQLYQMEIRQLKKLANFTQ